METVTYNEGGINWAWFTRLVVNHEAHEVEILRHWRSHKGDQWTEEELKAPSHPKYYHESIWLESKEGRIAQAYYVPVTGWCKITNPKYIFDYNERGENG